MGGLEGRLNALIEASARGKGRSLRQAEAAHSRPSGSAPGRSSRRLDRGRRQAQRELRAHAAPQGCRAGDDPSRPVAGRGGDIPGARQRSRARRGRNRAGGRIGADPCGREAVVPTPRERDSGLDSSGITCPPQQIYQGQPDSSGGLLGFDELQQSRARPPEGRLPAVSA